MSEEESYDTCADCRGDLRETGHTDHYGPRMTGEWSARERTEWSYRNGVVQWNPGDRFGAGQAGACDSRAPAPWQCSPYMPLAQRLALPDPDPELTLYRQITGRPAAGVTHTAWHTEFLATGQDFAKERMLALVTEHQHDDLLDGPATGITTFTEYRAPGARRQHWWWLDTRSLLTAITITIMLAVGLELIAIFTA